MNRPRLVLHLALALLCASLLGDVDGRRVVADVDGGCCMSVPAGAGDEGGFSGGLLLDVGEPMGVGNQFEHSSAATVDAADLRSPHGDRSSSAQGAAAAPPAPSTPLYLSHCVFLC